MRSKEFSRILRDFSGLIMVRRDISNAIGDLASALEANGSNTVSSVFDAARKDDAKRHSRGVTAAQLAEVFHNGMPFFEAVMKKGPLDDIRILLNFLRKRSSSSVADVVETMLASKDSGQKAHSQDNRPIIQSYVDRLNKALGTKWFADIFSELCADVNVKRAEAVAIATEVSGKLAKSTTKRCALKEIEAAHVRLEGARARNDYFDGQSAA